MAANDARAIAAAREARESLVEIIQVRNGLCSQSGRPLSFECDRCAFGVVLVVGVGIQRGCNDAVELVDQSVQSLQRFGTLNLQYLSRGTSSFMGAKPSGVRRLGSRRRCGKGPPARGGA